MVASRIRRNHEPRGSAPRRAGTRPARAPAPALVVAGAATTWSIAPLLRKAIASGRAETNINGRGPAK